MLKLKRFLILFSVISLGLSFQRLAAQKIEIISSKQIQYDGNILSFNKSDDIFEQDKWAYTFYNRSKKNFKSAKDWGYTSLGSLVFGSLLIAVDHNNGSCDGLCFAPGTAIGIISVVIGFPLCGTIGIIQHGSARSLQRKAVNQINRQNGIKSNKTDAIKLSFGIASNGIGWTVSF